MPKKQINNKTKELVKIWFKNWEDNKQPSSLEEKRFRVKMEEYNKKLNGCY